MSMQSQSLQSAVRPHECVDTYYADSHNSKVQCFPATTENRFVVALNSLASGSQSSVIFNPDGLVSDICLTCTLPALPPSASYAGVGLTRGWLWQLVRQIGVRYAGSSLYYFQGEEVLITALADCEDSVKRDQLLSLGGAELKSPADWANEDLRTATIYIKLPHNSPSAQEKPIGFPTDSISSPLQLQIEFKNFSDVFLLNGGATSTSIPSAFSNGEVQFKQAHLQDRADSIAAREDLSKKALSIPLKYFTQSQFQASLPSVASGVNQQISLTGFRAGSVQGIYVWAVRDADLSSVTAKQPLRYVPLRNVELSVNGLVYFRASRNSAQFWDLVERKTASAVSTTTLAYNGGTGNYDATAAVAYWVWIPFAQGTEVLRDETMLTNGLGIANSVVNLTLDTGGAGAVQVYAAYIYNATLLASGGSVEYVF